VIPWEQSLRDVLDDWRRRAGYGMDEASAADLEKHV
jgi:hypothetical protein